MSVAAFAAAAAMTMPIPAAAGGTVDIASRTFSPSHLQVLVGDTVTWRNHDASPHAVRADDGSFASARLAHGDTYELTFTEPGVHAYFCTLHPTMRGTVHVDALALLGPARTLRPGDTAHLSVVAPEDAGEVTLHRVTAAGEEPVASRPVDAEGRADFHVPVDRPVRLRARAGELTSAITEVRVAPRVTAVAARTGSSVAVRATVAPALPGATVRLERYVRLRFAFVGVKTARLGADGQVAFKVRAPRRTVLRVAVTHAAGGWAPAASPRAVVSARRR